MKARLYVNPDDALDDATLIREAEHRLSRAALFPVQVEIRRHPRIKPLDVICVLDGGNLEAC